MTDDELKAIEGTVRAVNLPCAHHTTMQDAVIFDLLQTKFPKVIADLRAAREALREIMVIGTTGDGNTRECEIACKALGEPCQE